MSKVKKQQKAREDVIDRTLDALKENYPEDVSTLLSATASKASKSQARKHLAKGNDELIQDMLLVDDRYCDRFKGPVRITVSLALSSFIAMAVFAIIAIFFVHPGAGEINYIAIVAVVELAAGIFLLLHYRYMLSRYLELRITESFAPVA